jgi:hypothetical protein
MKTTFYNLFLELKKLTKKTVSTVVLTFLMPNQIYECAEITAVGMGVPEWNFSEKIV